MVLMYISFKSEDMEIANTHAIYIYMYLHKLLRQNVMVFYMFCMCNGGRAYNFIMKQKYI